MTVVKGARMAPRLASDWSSDVRSHVMVGNRGPVVKRDRGLTGSHVIWETADQGVKRDRGLRQPEVTWIGMGNRGPVVKRDRGLREVT